MPVRCVCCEGPEQSGKRCLYYLLMARNKSNSYMHGEQLGLMSVAS